MQYEQTTAHMEDSSNHSSICFKCHPEHTCFGMGLPKRFKGRFPPIHSLTTHTSLWEILTIISIEVLMRHAI